MINLIDDDIFYSNIEYLNQFFNKDVIKRRIKNIDIVNYIIKEFNIKNDILTEIMT